MSWSDRFNAAQDASALVVSLDEAKHFLRIAGSDDDQDLARMILVATARCQEFTRRQFLTATRTFVRCEFPEGCGTLEIPRAPLQSVTSVRYRTADNVWNTWEATNYVVDADSEPGRIYLKTGSFWPLTFGPSAVEVVYTAGYGDTSASIPEPIRHAVLMAAGTAFDFRSELSRGSVMTIPIAVEQLLMPYVIGDEFADYGGSHDD